MIAERTETPDMETEFEWLAQSVIRCLFDDDQDEHALVQRQKQIDIFKKTHHYKKLKGMETRRNVPDHYRDWLMEGPEISLAFSKRKFWNNINKWKKHVYASIRCGKITYHHFSETGLVALY